MRRPPTIHLLLVVALVAWSWLTFPSWEGPTVVTALALTTLTGY